MTLDDEITEDHRCTWDPLVERLQDLRRAAGSPSFQAVTDLVVARRVADGAPPAAARLARSTLYDTFRTGRPRVNLALVRESALVLGADDATVDRWIAECRPPVSPAPEPASEVDGPSRRSVALLLLACLVLNLLGREFVDFLHLPIYLDMTGTAIAAIALGPWRGAAVGVGTNLLGALGSGALSIPFGLVNVVGALVWGYGVRRFGMGRTLPRFFVLNLAVAWACTVVAVPIIVLTLQHDPRIGHDVVTQLVSDSVDMFVVAVAFSNLLTSTTDKLLAGFVALVVVTALPWRMRRGVPLVLADHRHPAAGPHVD